MEKQMKFICFFYRGWRKEGQKGNSCDIIVPTIDLRRCRKEGTIAPYPTLRQRRRQSLVNMV